MICLMGTEHSFSTFNNEKKCEYFCQGHDECELDNSDGSSDSEYNPIVSSPV